MRAPNLSLTHAVALAAVVGFASFAPPAAAQGKPKPSLSVRMIEARTHPDSRWFGENAYHFRVVDVNAANLEGETLTWNLHVKRKLGDWKKAWVWTMDSQKVMAAKPRDVAYALLYRNLAKAKFQPGEHVAAIVATLSDGKTVVFRGEIAFNLPATGVNAYRPSDFVNKKRR